MDLGQLESEQDDLWLLLYAVGVGAFAKDEIERFCPVMNDLDAIVQFCFFKGREGQFNIFWGMFNQEQVDRTGAVRWGKRRTWSRTQSLRKGKKSGDRRSQCNSEPLDGGERGIALAGLDIAHVSAVEFCALSEFLLRYLQTRSEAFYLGSEPLPQVDFVHGPH